ncbi:outer membrane protein assembly factor BamB [Paraburkholderia sp. BL23I1N1]|uniref:outer membrane protein assembly factor BamB family protein n=1 Tax=Paraburkholderia sp. BL23I1N1 TaxID=1938802 RepID=UPI000E72741C|nr:PQQ-binding-like beta-propeller repeat protein [Paraburkholderia sp. BL23I1N1]RKE23924.1 outer membrane protein assembly factor BamB [Paraburkholderia sp. BL23I1N1]
MNDFSQNRQSLLRDLIESKCVFRAPKHRLVSSSGKSLSWLIDLRPILLSSEGLDTLAELFWTRYADQLPFQVGGMEMAAVPLVAAILMNAARKGYNVTGFIIHKERKRYGRMNAIEGDVSDAPVLLVDDIFNSGTSLEQSRVVLEEISRTIWKVWSVIDYGSRTGTEWQKRHGVTVESAYALEDFGLKLSVPKSHAAQLSFVTRWVAKTESANHHYVVPKSAPRAQNGFIYFGTDAGEMRCVDGASGQTRWSFKIEAGRSKGIWSTPYVTHDRVFFGGYDGNLYALCAENGREIWRYVEPDWIGSSPAYAADLGLVFIGVEYASPTRAGGVTAIDAKSGQKVWEYPTRCYVHGSPLYVADIAAVLCGTNDGALVALDAHTGAVRWQFQTNGAIKHAPALDLERRQVVFGSFDGGIRGVSLDTGELRFCIQTGNAVYTTPLIDGARAWCGSTDKYLYVIDLATGEGIAKIGAHSKIFSSPARIGPWVWFGSTNGRVRAIDPATFALAGVFQLPDAVTSAVEYDSVNRMLIVVSIANRLYGISVMPPVLREQSEDGQSQIDVTALQLARLTVDAVINHTPLPDPERYRLTGAYPHGGVFVSLRNQTTLQRIGRGGQWTFDAAGSSPEMSVIVATTKACANLSIDSLRETIVSVSLFGPLEQTTLEELNHEKFGIVVRATAGAKLGGALPNSPEYSNEQGQYLHALRNAKFTQWEGHTLYRHTVERQAEDLSWPVYGAPFPYDEADLTRFVAWLLSPGGRAESQDFYSGLADRLSALAVTRYVDALVAGSNDARRQAVDAKVTTILLPVAGMQNADVSDLKESVASQRTGAERVLLSLIFKGRSVGERTRLRGHFRMDRDALICRNDAESQVFLPALNMQRGMDAETLIATLPDFPAATWEIAPCWTWAVEGEANPLLVRGMTDAILSADSRINGSAGAIVDVSHNPLFQE